MIPLSRFLTLVIMVAVSSLWVAGCSSSKNSIDRNAKLPQALLWKVEGRKLKEPSYVFGTIHLIPQENFFLPVGFDEAFKEADEIVFEIDLDDMNDIGNMFGLLGNLMMNDGTTIDELMTPSEYKEVSAFFDEMGLPMMLLNRVKPMFLSMLAEVNIDPTQMESGDMMSYEMELFDQANNAKKPSGGLETLEYQISLFDSIPYKQQAQMLLDAVRSSDISSDGFDQMVELYTTQDIEGMVSMMDTEEAGGLGEFEDILLTRRNQNWIPLMKEMMVEGDKLFAVGAGHLGGPNGVIRLLQKEGYKVTPVSVWRAVTPQRL